MMTVRCFRCGMHFQLNRAVIEQAVTASKTSHAKTSHAKTSLAKATSNASNKVQARPGKTPKLVIASPILSNSIFIIKLSAYAMSILSARGFLQHVWPS